MASCFLLLPLFLLTTSVSQSNGQSTSVGNNVFDSLDSLGCKQFKSIIMEAQLQETFKSSLALTLFVYNDTAFNMMPPNTQLYDIDKQLMVSEMGAREYVNSFTLPGAMETTSFSPANPYSTYSVKGRKLFLNKKQLREGNVASGTPGPTKYFCNGAVVTRPNIQAGQHVIHIIGQVLQMPLEYKAFAYVSGYNPQNLRYKFFEFLMEPLRVAPQEDGEFNYNRQVLEVLNAEQVTFFIPSNEAMERIPQQRLTELRGDVRRLLYIITLHIVPNQVLYTSLVNHNERFNTQLNSGAVIFRKNFNKEAVYVTATLTGGDSVTALLNPANVTVLNGVVHHVDAVLGFVYKTTFEEISLDPLTQNFEQVINSARADLKSALTASSGVVVFVPTNEAMYAIANVYQNYINNQSLLNMITERSMLQQGQRLSLTDHSGGYESYITAVSRYNGERIKLYSMGNDTWVEGGYVKARVVKPDIGTLNGMVHQIDAVFGVPTRDIPKTIECEDWLESTYIQMKYVGLDRYMRDPSLTRNQNCQFSSSSNTNTNTNNNYYGNNQYDQFQGLCGDGIHRCQFTFFVPNGTAIDAFARTETGRRVMNDTVRWRWILRRLISHREVIYIDKLRYGAPRSFYADNGEEVVVQTDSRNNIPSGSRKSYVMFEGVRAEIIHSDLGATNGVIHIINSLLYLPGDLPRDVSADTVNNSSLPTGNLTGDGSADTVNNSSLPTGNLTRDGSAANFHNSSLLAVSFALLVCALFHSLYTR